MDLNQSEFERAITSWKYTGTTSRVTEPIFQAVDFSYIKFNRSFGEIQQQQQQHNPHNYKAVSFYGDATEKYSFPS